ncbi:MAG: N-acetylmuramic acid 6-phosphate etherase, partial [Planctomycetota bacterium]
MENRGHLLTELRNPRSMHIDRMSIAEAVDLINSEDAGVAQAVANAKAEIARAIELVVA